jgi:hypothetical protein
VQKRERERLESLVGEAADADAKARDAIEAARREGQDPGYLDRLESQLPSERAIPSEAGNRAAPRPIEVLPVLPADGRAL